MPLKMIKPSLGVSISSFQILNPSGSPIPNERSLVSTRSLEDCAGSFCTSRIHRAHALAVVSRFRQTILNQLVSEEVRLAAAATAPRAFVTRGLEQRSINFSRLDLESSPQR